MRMGCVVEELLKKIDTLRAFVDKNDSISEDDIAAVADVLSSLTEFVMGLDELLEPYLWTLEAGYCDLVCQLSLAHELKKLIGRLVDTVCR